MGSENGMMVLYNCPIRSRVLGRVVLWFQLHGAGNRAEGKNKAGVLPQWENDGLLRQLG